MASPLEMSEPTRAVTPPNPSPNNVNPELTATPERVRQVELNRVRGISLVVSIPPVPCLGIPAIIVVVPLPFFSFLFFLTCGNKTPRFLCLISSQGKTTREGSISARVDRRYLCTQR
jgi:hypothetical protein